jgi:hypothetical protein
LRVGRAGIGGGVEFEADAGGAAEDLREEIADEFFLAVAAEEFGEGVMVGGVADDGLVVVDGDETAGGQQGMEGGVAILNETEEVLPDGGEVAGIDRLDVGRWARGAGFEQGVGRGRALPDLAGAGEVIVFVIVGGGGGGVGGGNWRGILNLALCQSSGRGGNRRENRPRPGFLYG